jgi:putative flippase GtrA
VSPALLKSLARFCLVGGLVTALAYLAFMGLLRLGLHYLLASAAVWACSVGLNYLLSRSFTFARTNGPGTREFAVFVAGNVLQLALGSANYWVLIGVLGAGPTAAFICNVPLTAVFGFVFMRWVVFPSPRAALHPAG